MGGKAFCCLCRESRRRRCVCVHLSARISATRVFRFFSSFWSDFYYLRFKDNGFDALLFVLFLAVFIPLPQRDELMISQRDISSFLSRLPRKHPILLLYEPSSNTSMKPHRSYLSIVQQQRSTLTTTSSQILSHSQSDT